MSTIAITHDFLANDPRWDAILDQARRQRNAINLPSPAGLSQIGRYNLKRRERRDGSTAWSLYYISAHSRTTIGWFVERAPEVPVDQPRVFNGWPILRRHSDGNLVAIFRDHTDMPTPVPLEIVLTWTA